VEFYGRYGGNVPSAEEVFAKVMEKLEARAAGALEEVLSHV
jgi:hypothetical protein